LIYKEVAVFEAGDSFGEYALVDNKKGTRAARIVAADQCVFGVLNAENYKKSISKIEMRHRSDMVDFLLGMPQFSSLSRIQISKHIIKINNCVMCKN